MFNATDPAQFTSINSLSGRALQGSCLALRGAQGAAGGLMVLISLGLWFAPGANWAGDVLLFKLLASVMAGMGGVALLQDLVRVNVPNVEIDTIRHEIRLVKTAGKHRRILDRCRFSDLARVVNTGSHVQLWNAKNGLIAEVAAVDRLSHRSLVTALRVAGKL